MRILSPTIIIHDGLTSLEPTNRQQLDTKISYSSLASGGVSLVQFKQLGSVSTPRSLYDKLEATLSASDFGAVGDLVYEPLTLDTVFKISGTDSTISIQNALDKAGLMATENSQLSNPSYVRVIIERGQYLISGSLVVPPFVEIDCQGVLFNFISDPSTPIVTGKAFSLCSQLYIHANGKTGVQWGEPGIENNCDLGKMVVSHVGSARNGLLVKGRKFISRSLWIDGGLNGIYLDHVGDFAGVQSFISRAINGVKILGCESVELKGISLKNCIQNGVLIDESNHIVLEVDATVESDNNGLPMVSGLTIGGSSTTNSYLLDIIYRAQSTGGWGALLDYVEDSSLDLQLSNTRSSKQTSGVASGGYASSHLYASPSGCLLAHNIGTLYNQDETTKNVAAIRYGQCISGYLSITLLKSSGIPSSIGTTYGKLSVVDPDLLQLSNVSIEGVLPGQFVKADANGKLIGADLFGGGSTRTTFRSMVYSQDALVTSLSVSHKWGIYPQVEVLDPTTHVLLPEDSYDVYYESLNLVRLVFNQPFIGDIVLNGGADIRLSSGTQIKRSEVYVQQTPSISWVVSHNWDTFPSVVLIDPTTKKRLLVNVQYLDSNSIQVTPSVLTTGIVSLNTSAKVPPSSLPGVGLGNAGTTYDVFTQDVPSPLWVIDHNWGLYPSVSIIDPNTRQQVFAEIRYPNDMQVRISFSNPFAGYAVLNSGANPIGIGLQSGVISSDAGYFLVYKKTVPDYSWIIRHSYGHYPSVVLVDPSGGLISSINASIYYLDIDTVQIVFSDLFYGTAYLSLGAIAQASVLARQPDALLGEVRTLSFPLSGDTWVDYSGYLWLIANGRTFGSAESGSDTSRSDLLPLFLLLWQNTELVIQNSTGELSDRTEAAADFRSGKRLVLPNKSGATTTIIFTGL